MIITICGSVRLGREVWDKLAEDLTFQGHLVFTVNVWNQYDCLHSEQGERDKYILDAVHKEKIRRSDFVYILHKDNYMGPSTQSEFEHALKHDVPVRFVAFDKIQSSEQKVNDE